MSASYPTAIPSFSTKNTNDIIQAATDNSEQDELVAIATDLISGLARLRLGTNSTTVAGGVITVTKSQYAIETEGAAATDDLDTITAGSGIGAGSLLLLIPANVSHVVTVKDSTGNVKLASGDCALNSAKRSLLLSYDGTNWVEVASPVQAATTLQVGYAATLHDSNGTTKTAIVSFDVAANDWADGDTITVEIVSLDKNNKGSSGTYDIEVVAGAGSAIALCSASSTADSATEYLNQRLVKLVRKGADVYAVVGDPGRNAFGLDFSNGLTLLTGPSTPSNFTSTVTVAIKATLSANHATFYIKPQSARIKRQKSVAS